MGKLQAHESNWVMQARMDAFILPLDIDQKCEDDGMEVVVRLLRQSVLVVRKAE